MNNPSGIDLVITNCPDSSQNRKPSAQGFLVFINL